MSNLADDSRARTRLAAASARRDEAMSYLTDDERDEVERRFAIHFSRRFDAALIDSELRVRHAQDRADIARVIRANPGRLTVDRAASKVD